MSNKYNIDECKYPEIRLMSEGTYYGQSEVFVIDAEEYNRLLKAELMLQALMNAGVVDWCSFSDAVSEYSRLEKELE